MIKLIKKLFKIKTFEWEDYSQEKAKTGLKITLHDIDYIEDKTIQTIIDVEGNHVETDFLMFNKETGISGGNVYKIEKIEKQ